MNAVDEPNVRWLASTVAGERRLQARIAVTGSVADLAARIRRVIDASSGDWQAELSTRYMIEFAARYRAPEQVADLVKELSPRFSAATVLDAASERPPAELAEILAKMPDPAEFVRTVAARRRPADIAVMFAAMSQEAPILRAATSELCSLMAPDTAAQVIVHLRGMNASAALSSLLTMLPWRSSGTDLGEVLVNLDSLGDAESVHEAISSVLALRNGDWLEAESADADVADRVTAVVHEFRRHARHAVATDVVTRAKREFAQPGRWHLLCALIIAFRELEMDTDAWQLADAIEESPDGDSTETVLNFCRRNKEYAGALLQVFLKKPRPGAAVRFASEPVLNPERKTIFEAVAEWPCEYLKTVTKELSSTQSNLLADEFRADVARIAAARADVDDIGEIVCWLLEDWAADQGMQQANQVIADVIARRKPEILIEVISKLRALEVQAGAPKGWWFGPNGSTVRDEAERRLSEHYGIDEMTMLTDAAAGRCIPAVHRMSAYWLTHGVRRDGEVGRLITALMDAKCTYEELKETVRWVANNFRRPDGSDPLGVLTATAEAALLKNKEDTVLMRLRNEWFGVKRGSRLRRIPRPDPDRARG